MPTGVLFALLAYSIWSLGDSVVKSFSGDTMSVFEIVFFVNLFTLVALPFVKSSEDSWADTFRLRHPLLTHVRSLLYVGASLCFNFAVTHIPFAETYSLAFLAPFFVTVLSVLVLKEKVVLTRWLLVALSFIGVLVVVRPGFRELGVGQLAAAGCALFAASGNIILRHISGRERQVSILAVNSGYQLVITGALMLGSFVAPSVYDIVRLGAVGLINGAAQILIVRGLKRSPASHVGPTQYVQIIWAIVLGAIFYAENEDLVGYCGLVLIVLAGIATIFSDGAQARISGRWTEFRARRNGSEVNRIEEPEG
jgi:drug/metabolite transporter (DMT)-like permease